MAWSVTEPSWYRLIEQVNDAEGRRALTVQTDGAGRRYGGAQSYRGADWWSRSGLVML